MEAENLRRQPRENSALTVAALVSVEQEMLSDRTSLNVWNAQTGSRLGGIVSQVWTEVYFQ